MSSGIAGWADKLRDLARPERLKRFMGVHLIGTGVDYGIAVALSGLFGAAALTATTLGFAAGTTVNYLGHTVFSFADRTGARPSLVASSKYLMSVLAALAVRLGVVELLGWATPLPYWLILLVAIGVSFVASYVIAALWVFRAKT